MARDKSLDELERETADLHKKVTEKLRELRKQRVLTGSDYDEIVLAQLDEPRTFLEVRENTGLPAEELCRCFEALYAAGKIERWDLPRFVRSGLGTSKKKELLQKLGEHSPIRQGGAENLTGLSTGTINGMFGWLEKRGKAESLGPLKGDPWFIARGTKDVPIVRPEPGPRRRRTTLPGTPKRARRPSKGP